MKRGGKLLYVWLSLLLLVGCESGSLAQDDFVIQIQSLGESSSKLRIDDAILQQMNNDSPAIDVLLVFDEGINVDEESYTYQFIADEESSGNGKYYFNDKIMDDHDVEALNKIILSERDKAIAATKKLRQQIINDLKNAYGLKINSNLENEFINSYEPLALTISKTELEALTEYPILLGIEAPKIGSATIVSAMNATGVIKSFSNIYNRQGDDVGVFVGEWDGCPPNSYSTNYSKLVSGDPDDTHGRMVVGILRNVSPLSTIYCRARTSLNSTNHFPKPADIGSSAHTPPIFISNHSFGYFSSNYDSYDKMLDDLAYNQGITSVVAAGNEGNTTGYIRSPGHGLNVITVGNYNDNNNQPNLFEINSSSSYLPAPDTKNIKPELSAPGTGITLPGFLSVSGTSMTCTGTSCAAPHVAGMLANQNSHWSTPNYASFTPALAKSLIMQGATDSVIGGYDRVGFGGADYYRMSHVYAYWWHKGNYNSLDAADNSPNNGMIDTYLNLTATSGKARAVVSWVTRGSWTYAHRNDSFPIGSEYRFRVYDPGGNQIAGGWNRYNGFMVLDFNVNTTGVYHFTIERMALRDTAYPSLNMAVSIYK